jgi:hypothetical protein
MQYHGGDKAAAGQASEEQRTGRGGDEPFYGDKMVMQIGRRWKRRVQRRGVIASRCTAGFYDSAVVDVDRLVGQ